MESVKPVLFKYLDYRSYLKDLFAYLLESNRKYSQRWIAKKAGLKSPQLISMVLKGDRKLSVENAQLLAMALGFTEKEEEYFLILIELEQAQAKEKQLEILDRIRFQFQNGLFKDIPDSGYEYIRKWFYPAIREVYSLKNVRVKPKDLAEVLQISAEEMKEGMDLLVNLGFLKKIETGYERAEPSLRAEDYVSPMVMVQYHLQLLEKAFQAVQLKRDFRHFDSLIVALSHKDIDAVRTKIHQFVREIDMIAESSGRRDDIFQLSIQFFSLTGGRLPEVNK